MNRQAQLISATVLVVVGAVSIAGGYLGGGQLSAASLSEQGFDLAKIFIWAGVGALVTSALLFISLSAK